MRLTRAPSFAGFSRILSRRCYFIVGADRSTDNYSVRVSVPKFGTNPVQIIRPKKIWLEGLVRYSSIQGQLFETPFCFLVEFPSGRLTEFYALECGHRT